MVVPLIGGFSVSGDGVGEGCPTPGEGDGEAGGRWGTLLHGPVAHRKRATGTAMSMIAARNLVRLIFHERTLPREDIAHAMPVYLENMEVGLIGKNVDFAGLIVDGGSRKNTGARLISGQEFPGRFA